MMRYVAILAVLLCATGRVNLAEEPHVVELWPGKAPEEPGTIGEEKIFPSKPNKERSETTEVTRLITNVTQPTITIYRPAKEKDTGAAMLICPGGGYHNLWWQLEGEEVAAWLNSIGVTGILLKYRVPRRPDDVPGEHPARRPLQDAQRAAIDMKLGRDAGATQSEIHDDAVLGWTDRIGTTMRQKHGRRSGRHV